MDKKWNLLFLILLTVVISSCSLPGSNPVIESTTADGDTAGFLDGLFHGFIIYITFFVSLFDSSINIYEVRNNGTYYNIGYFFGLTSILGGSTSTVSRSLD